MRTNVTNGSASQSAKCLQSFSILFNHFNLQSHRPCHCLAMALPLHCHCTAPGAGLVRRMVHKVNDRQLSPRHVNLGRCPRRVSEIPVPRHSKAQQGTARHHSQSQHTQKKSLSTNALSDSLPLGFRVFRSESLSCTRSHTLVSCSLGVRTGRGLGEVVCFMD